MVALRWSDLDLEGGRLSIERGVVRVGRELIEQGTKTHQSRRITLDETTLQRLQEHRIRANEVAGVAGCSISPESFVFSRAADGKIPWRPDSTTRAFRLLCNRAGVAGIRLHDLRHYVATRMLTAGVDVRTCRR